MKKYYLYIILSLYAILIGISAFYSTNLILSDVANYELGLKESLIISSLPSLLFTIELIALLFTTIRINFNLLNKDETNRVNRKIYLLISILSTLGILLSLYSGIFIYHSFKTYPIPYFYVFSIIVHAMLLLIPILKFKTTTKPIKEKLKIKNIIYYTILSLFAFLAFNRFGAFLFAFEYASKLTLYMTWPFYISLLLPICILVNMLLFRIKTYNKKPLVGIIVSSIILLLSIVLYGYTMIFGSIDTMFISAISPALPIERLITMPVDVILQSIIIFAIDIYFLIFAIINNKTIRGSHE